MWWTPRGHVLGLEDPQGHLTVLGSQVVDLDTCILDSITASDDDDVSALWHPLYESIGHILR